MPQQQQAAFAKTRTIDEEVTSDENTRTTITCKEAKVIAEKPERLSDEKIIAQILKPAERLQISKSSDKLLKLTGTNTAISLD